MSILQQKILTQLSYYSDVNDFLTLGEGTYPNDNGLKGNITSTLINGTEEDFKTNKDEKIFF